MNRAKAFLAPDALRKFLQANYADTQDDLEILSLEVSQDPIGVYVQFTSDEVRFSDKYDVPENAELRYVSPKETV